MKYNNQGNSLLEIIVALAIFILFASTLTSMILGNLSLLTSSGQHTQAGFLAQEAMEAIYVIKDRSWNELVYAQSAIEQNGYEWELSGEGTSELIGDYTRYIEFDNIYRDSQENIVPATSSEAKLDTFSKKIKTNISWINSRNKTIILSLDTIMTNWRTEDWEQEDWIGGDSQAVWSIADRFDNEDGNIDYSQNGEISLLEIATSTYANLGTLESSAYFMGANSHANALWWEDEIDPACAGCSIELRIKTAPDNSGAPGSWSNSWCGPNGDDGNNSDFFEASSTKNIIHRDHNNDQWIKYQANLVSDTLISPKLKKVIINYKR